MRKLLVFTLVTAEVSTAAIPAATVWEVRTTGADTNGGGFDQSASPSIDYSEHDNRNAPGCSNCGSSSVNLSTNDAVITAASTTVTSATAGFTNAITGNIIYFSGGSCGTGAINTQWRRAAYANGTTITLDQAPTGTFTGTCTGITMNIGGAIASPSIVASNKVAGNDVYIRAGTYTLSSITTTASNGVVLDSTGGTVTNNSVWWGYNSTRGDDGIKPLLQMSGISSVSLFKITGNNVTVRNLSFDGASGTSIKCYETTAAYTTSYRLTAVNCTNRAFDLSSNTAGNAAMLEASGCSTTSPAILISAAMNVVNVAAHDNTVSGITVGAAAACAFCFSYRNTGASSDGFTFSGGGGTVINSVAAYNGRAGVDITGIMGNAAMLVNVISYGNAAGILTNQVQDAAHIFHSATGGNTTNYNANQLVRRIGHVDLAADPFTNVSSSANGAADFSLNTATGGGAALRAAGFVGVSATGASTGYQDIGPVQHADPPGSSGGQKGYTWVQ
jgi:hypothetical protein